jgi:hypothetical protein
MAKNESWFSCTITPNSIPDLSAAAHIAAELNADMPGSKDGYNVCTIFRRLYQTTLIIDGAVSVPLNFVPRNKPPRLLIDVELRGNHDGLRIELDVEDFIRMYHGDFLPRFLALYALAKVKLCGAKYGFIRSSGWVVHEFRNLDLLEDEQALWAAALTLVPPHHLQRIERELGFLDAEQVALRQGVPVSFAEDVLTAYRSQRRRLLDPTLPDGWHDTRFVVAEEFDPTNRRKC